MRSLDDACRDLAPPLRNGSWRENVEVFVVAISIALGVRTYFVQPFTIPTGSMQPTLNGIITKPTNNPPPNIAQRAMEWFVLGRDYFQIIAKRSERIVDVQERHAFGIKLGLATYSVVVTDQGEYSAYVPLAALKADMRCSPGRKVEPGAIIACGECNTGDHVLVVASAIRAIMCWWTKSATISDGPPTPMFSYSTLQGFQPETTYSTPAVRPNSTSSDSLRRGGTSCVSIRPPCSATERQRRKIPSSG
jgi:hypothetical protein